MQVRQNAREYQNSIKDLYSWEKEIKSKEEALKHAPAPKIQPKSAPVRSHVAQANETTTTASKVQKCVTGSPGSSAASTPTEKQDLPHDALAQQHKKANDIKDRGNNYAKQADYERAIEAYTEAVEIYPYDPIYFTNRALCHIKLERYVNCIDDCEAAISLDKLCVKAYYRRMQANESLGNNMEALKDCTTVLTLDPKNFEAKRSLERINERLRKIANKHGPNFNAARDDLIDILPFDKPAYKRSKKPMRRVPVVDIISPRPSLDESKQLRISDDDIDKIFNSNCGPFEEVKRENVPKPAAQTVSMETNKKLDVRNQESKQASAQSKVIDISTNSSEQLAKTSSKEDVKSKDSNKNIKFVGKTILEVPQEEVKDSNKTSRGLEKTMETEKTSYKPDPQVKETTSTERVPASPAGTAQFYITWKELSPVQKYYYLKSIEIPNLCKILGAGFDSDTFTDLLRTLQDFYVPNKEPTTAAVLLEISKNDEFTILAMLMSQEEKKMVTAVMDAIKEFPKSNKELLEKLGKAYNLA
ncbi:hypothetical protein ACLKA7_014465 [Drosophila subpalustris]